MTMSLMDSPAATQVGRKRVSLSFGFGAVMDFNDAVPGGMSQPRACGTCARAKAKCVTSPGSNEKCERCQRLKKVCEPAINRSREKRPQDSTRVRKNRVAKLEEKLDGLVTLLKSTQENTSTTPQQPRTSSTLSQPSPPVIPNVDHQETLEERNAISHSLTLPTSSTQEDVPIPPKVYAPLLATAVPNLTLNHSPLTGRDEEDDDELLRIFRSEICPKFPFATVSESVRAEDLRRDRPYFHASIVAVATRNSAKQTEIWKWLIQQLTERMFHNGERNIDLLLAVLTFLTWGGNHFFNMPRFTSLVASTSILVADLGLNRPPLMDLAGPFRAAIRQSCGYPFFNAPVRTTEHRRILLGCFVLQSTVSAYFHRIDPPRLTPYVEECCQVLNDLGDHPGDKCAVLFFKLQAVQERIACSPWHGGPTFSGGVAPPILFLKPIEEQLEAIHSQFPVDSPRNEILLLSYHYTKVLLYKICLSPSPESSRLGTCDFNRLSLLYSCLQATVTFLETFFAMPIAQYHTIPMPTFAQITNTLGVLQLVSTFEHPDWDLSWVRTKMSFTGTIGMLAERMEEAKATLGYDRHTSERIDLFSEGAKRLTWVKACFEGKITAPSQDLRDTQESTDFRDIDSTLLGDPVMDDLWLRDIFGPWDYQSAV